MPLVINSLGADTHTHTHKNTYTDIRTETILRNQAMQKVYLKHHDNVYKTS